MPNLCVAPLGQIISDLYSFALSIVGFAVFIMFLYIGVSMLFGRTIAISGGRAYTRPFGAREAWGIARDVIIGTVILFAVYLILNTINPQLTRLDTGACPPNQRNQPVDGFPGSGDSNSPEPTPSVTFAPGGGRSGGGGASGEF